MGTHHDAEESTTIWTPLYRADLEALLTTHTYTRLHLSLLYWLLWFPLLSAEELLRLLSIEKGNHLLIATQADLSREIDVMIHLGLIEAITLHEPQVRRHLRYYVTDMGLYLYLSTVHSSPPLSIARLAKAYPVERDDLLARLARPDIHLALTEFVTRLIEEGEPHGYHLLSYQQPWQHNSSIANTRHILRSDAALLLQSSGAPYAYLVYIDVGPYHRADRHMKRFLTALLDLRRSSVLYRHDWPAMLIISTQDRLPRWARLLLESSLARITKPLVGGITTQEMMNQGLFTPIWQDLVTLASVEHYKQAPSLSFSQLLQAPASADIIEHFSQYRRFYRILLKEAAAPPPRTKQRLTRYVGASLQDEAMHITREQLEAFFANKRRTRFGISGTGLLTLALTASEKEILSLTAHHPLLDILTFQALLRPSANARAIKPLQHTITHLFQQNLIETKIWPAGKTSLEQQRYLLTSTALKFLAIRQGEPFSFYFVLPMYRKGEDEQLWRQWGTAGLFRQMWHTNGIYTFMRQLVRGTYERGEVLLEWKSAHEAARWYEDSRTGERLSARPDAELVFATTPNAQRHQLLLEYDRGTTGAYEYMRKFKAYLDYQQATKIALPLLVVVTPSHKSMQRIQQVLTELGGELRITIVLERDVLTQGLTFVLERFPASPS
jgi:hypothetical protein